MTKLTKTHREKTVREIVDRYGIGEEFSPPDLALFNEMCGSNWPAAKHMRNPSFPSDPRHVHVLKAEGWSQFSWRNAIYPPSPRDLVKRVLRASIAPDLMAFREEVSEPECAHADRGNCNGDLQTDHEFPSFDEIANNYLSDHGMPEIVEGPPGTGRMFKDVAVEAQWIAYHARHALYQILCRTHNASKGKR